MDIVFEIGYLICNLIVLNIINLKDNKFLKYGKNNKFYFYTIIKNKSKHLKVNNKSNFYYLNKINRFIKIKNKKLDIVDNKIKEIQLMRSVNSIKVESMLSTLIPKEIGFLIQLQSLY